MQGRAVKILNCKYTIKNLKYLEFHAQWQIKKCLVADRVFIELGRLVISGDKLVTIKVFGSIWLFPLRLYEMKHFVN